MKRKSSPLQPPARGFSLVEILIGITIGLVGMLVMFRVVSVWDGHTRTTTAGSDAEIAGTLAMFSLERDIRQAGLGFGVAPPTEMGCDVAVHDTQDGRTFNFPLQPVQIDVSATAGAPATIRVLHGNSSFSTSQSTIKNSTATTNELDKDQRSGVKRGDLAVIAGSAGTLSTMTCELFEITDDAVGSSSVEHTNGNYTSFYAAASAPSVASRFNAPGGTTAAFGAATLYNLGPAPQLNTWQIADNRVLTRTDLVHNTAAFEVAEGVVNLQAEYGVDADPRDSQIVATEWTSMAPADWTRVLAVRVAMLVRSKHYERSADVSASGVAAVTAVAPSPSWTGSSFLMTNVDGSADSFDATTPDPNNWRYYRYRVYEKVIPLRNIIWGVSP